MTLTDGPVARTTTTTYAAHEHWPRSTFHLFSVYSSAARDSRTPILLYDYTAESDGVRKKKPKTIVTKRTYDNNADF